MIEKTDRRKYRDQCISTTIVLEKIDEIDDFNV